MKKYTLALFFVFMSSSANAICDAYNNDIEIEVVKDYGAVVFNDTLSRDEFKTIAGRSYRGHDDTSGLTVAKFDMSVETFGSQIAPPNAEYSCVYLEKIILYLSYENITVLIDKKYPYGSCQYDVILEHEMKHVAVHKKSMDYYAPYIIGAMEKAAQKIEPKVIGADENVEDALSSLSETLIYDVSDMLDYFEEERDKANDLLDTEENYEEERKKCTSW